LDGKTVKVQIWDTAGQERFRTITQTYYRGAHGVILAYDCTREESFENISNWVKQVEKHAAPGVQKILIGNKSDMTDLKVISKQRGEEMAKDNNMVFFETSALQGTGINEAFETISRKIIKEKQL
jgi:small GTP-binding protein